MATSIEKIKESVEEITNADVKRLCKTFIKTGDIQKAADASGYTRKVAYDTLWRYDLVGPRAPHGLGSARTTSSVKKAIKGTTNGVARRKSQAAA